MIPESSTMFCFKAEEDKMAPEKEMTFTLQWLFLFLAHMMSSIDLMMNI